MTTFYPVCVTVALFVALLLFDVIQRTPEKINGHIFSGLIVTFLMVYLSFKDMELVSWGLLLIPVVVLVTCYFLGYSSTTAAKSVPAVPAVPAAPAAPVSCDPNPKISTPESISIASKIISENKLCGV
jgi:hypothetical protein